jgi:hypothetical protein
MKKTLLALMCGVLPLDSIAQLYKCEQGGRVIYQEMQCPDGTGRPININNFSIVDSYDKRKPSSAPTPTVRRAGGGIEREPTVFVEGEHPGCAGMVERLNKIDQQARHRSTPKLKEDRRLTRRWIEDHDCQEIRF